MSRPSNLETLQSLADQVVWAIQTYVGGGVESVPQTVGTIYYVSNPNGDDGNTGLSPDEAKATIGAAITACAVGDAIVVGAGTYPEDVVLNKNSVQMFFDPGAIITAQAGVGLTVSSHYCYIYHPSSLIINPVANGTGCLISGNLNKIVNLRIACASSGDIGVDITGIGNVLTECKVADPLIAAFKIQGDQARLEFCITAGLAADTSIGYWVTNSADKFRFFDCASQGHINGGYVVDTGCTNGEAQDCVSGGGDGAIVDTDHAMAGDITIDDEIFKAITFAGAPTEYNMFKVTGTVRVTDIYGTIETQIANTASTLYLQVYSAGGTVDITDAPGTDIDSAPVGSFLVRKEASTAAITLASSATPSIVETTTFRDPKNPIDIVADADQTTYIRLVLSAALASGHIHWHCHYEPLSDDGFLEAA